MISTGLQKLDKFLSGGIPDNVVVDIFGGGATGKTLLLFQLLINSIKNGGNILYLDTSGGFRPERILEIQKESKIEINLLEKITVSRITNTSEQIKSLRNIEKNNFWFEKGLDLLNKKKINIAYQKYFFNNAIKAFKKNNVVNNLTIAQDQLIKINEDIFLKNNDYVQNINKKYLINENQLLKQELELIKSQRGKQIYLVSSLILILLSFWIWYFFKQKHKFKNKEILSLQQQKEITKLQAFIEGEEKERSRLAQDLHDGINGDLSSVKFQLSSLETSNLSSQNKLILDKAIGMLDYSCDNVRTISHNLSPTSIHDFGLINTVKNYCTKLEQLYPIKINFQHFGTEIKLHENIETVIYRIIQELVNNIIKHADASEALVQINSHENSLFIVIEDNGKGFDDSKENTGIGLKNIASRIAYLNATLETELSKNGTTFTINIDLNKIPEV